MNAVLVSGRLTTDVQMRGVKQNLAVFGIAVKDPFNQSVNFFQILTIGQRARFAAKHLRKGMKIIVMGALCSNNYNGTPFVQIRADFIEFAETKAANMKYMDNAAYVQPVYDDPAFYGDPYDSFENNYEPVFLKPQNARDGGLMQ